MTRRERFRLYARRHFTTVDPPAEPVRSGGRGTVERQTRRAVLARLARLTDRTAGPRP